MVDHIIPMKKNGTQLYKYSDVNLKSKIIMWFWKRFSDKIKYTTFYGKTITGEKKVYYGCTFIRCKFQNGRLLFINNCVIKHDTPNPIFTRFYNVEIKNCMFQRIDPLNGNIKHKKVK